MCTADYRPTGSVCVCAHWAFSVMPYETKLTNPVTDCCVTICRHKKTLFAPDCSDYIVSSRWTNRSLAPLAETQDRHPSQTPSKCSVGHSSRKWTPICPTIGDTIANRSLETPTIAIRAAPLTSTTPLCYFWYTRLQLKGGCLHRNGECSTNIWHIVPHLLSGSARFSDPTPHLSSRRVIKRAGYVFARFEMLCNISSIWCDFLV